jgi:hypothetical protein
MVGLPDEQLGKVMGPVKENRMLDRVRHCGILDSSPAPPQSILILKEAELFLPLFEVFVSYHHSLTLKNPQFFRCGMAEAVAGSLNWASPVQEDLAKLQHKLSCGEQSI